MIDNITLFDCTAREVGYQTGWFFDPAFLRDYYRFVEAAGYDYMELGFFHNPEADPGRGAIRYCGLCTEELNDIFGSTKNILKLSAMRDIQRPLAPVGPKADSVVDAVRILTRSKQTEPDVLCRHIEELQKLGYRIFINFTSAGRNTVEENTAFARLAKKMGHRRHLLRGHRKAFSLRNTSPTRSSSAAPRASRPAFTCTTRTARPKSCSMSPSPTSAAIPIRRCSGSAASGTTGISQPNICSNTSTTIRAMN